MINKEDIMGLNEDSLVLDYDINEVMSSIFNPKNKYKRSQEMILRGVFKEWD